MSNCFLCDQVIDGSDIRVDFCRKSKPTACVSGHISCVAKASASLAQALPDLKCPVPYYDLLLAHIYALLCKLFKSEADEIKPFSCLSQSLEYYDNGCKVKIDNLGF